MLLLLSKFNDLVSYNYNCHILYIKYYKNVYELCVKAIQHEPFFEMCEYFTKVKQITKKVQ